MNIEEIKTFLRHGDIGKISSLAMVSRVTVSKVLNGQDDDVKPMTKLKVLEIAEKAAKSNQRISKQVKNYYGSRDDKK